MSSPAEPSRAALVAAALAIVVFIGAWTLLHQGFYTRSQIIDTPVYQKYGDAIADGRVPYRDFRLEYPPGALPVFVVPALGHDDAGDVTAYRSVFEAVMWICGALALFAGGGILRTLGARPLRLAGALGFIALAPLALGSVYLSRFDLWPAALALGALAALLAGRPRLGCGLLGFAVAAKVWPGVILPLALASVWRHRGRREALVCAGVCVSILAAAFLPFAALAPRGVWHSIVVQATRPLQIESFGSSLLLAAHQVFGTSITMRSGYGSQNLAGGGAEVIGATQTLLQLAALVGIWVWFARGPADRERLVRAAAAAVCAFVALGKVLSPQFLIWLVPIVPLVRGRRGVAASALLLAALVLTQLWFPFRYWRLALSFEPVSSWLVLARDLVLVGLLVTLTAPLPKSVAARERTG